MISRERSVTMVALVAITISCVALSLYWARLVPIFEAPDEPTHYDYVMSIARAGHLIRERDALTAYYANADVFAVVAFTRQPEIAFHPDVRAARGYGDREYYERLDAAAAAALSETAVKRNPWIMTIYPFGYYALAALWLRIGELFTTSFSGLFFWVRALSSLMLGGTLVMTFAIARRLELSRERSLALVAAIGVLPLTSFVSSYVQPDNFAWFLLTAIWLMTLRLVRNTSWRGFVVLGALLGLLLDTKLQFFLAGAAGVLPYLYLKLRSQHPKTKIIALSCMGVPVIALAIVQAWVSADDRQHVLQGEHLWANSNAFWAAYAAGPQSLMIYVAESLRGALFEYFVNGRSFQSFWGIFGWMDTPLTFGSEYTDVAIRVALMTATIAVLVLSVIWAVRRLARFARALRVDPHAALEILYGDPVVPTYLSFLALMFVIYVYLDNTFGAQGRNWLPLIFPMLVIATQRLFDARIAQPAGTVAAVAFLAYAAVASAYAPHDLVSRYYADAAVPRKVFTARNVPFPLTQTQTLADIDPLSTSAAAGGPAVVSQGDRLDVEGWAVDSIHGMEPYSVFITVDDRIFFPAYFGEERPDVAKALGDSRYLHSGFVGSVDTRMLRPGHHVLFLRVVPSTGAFAYRSTASRQLLIR